MKLGQRRTFRGFEDEKGSYFHHRRNWRDRAKFWMIGFVICMVGAAAAIYIKGMFDSVSQSKFLRYEPVDVPPPDVSSRHFKERVEYERRDLIIEERARKSSGQ